MDLRLCYCSFFARNVWLQLVDDPPHGVDFAFKSAWGPVTYTLKSLQGSSLICTCCWADTIGSLNDWRHTTTHTYYIFLIREAPHYLNLQNGSHSDPTSFHLYKWVLLYNWFQVIPTLCLQLAQSELQSSKRNSDPLMIWALFGIVKYRTNILLEGKGFGYFDCFTFCLWIYINR